MQKRIYHLLDRPYPAFLSSRRGMIYFIWMILIQIALANITQPFGLINFHEFHKPLVVGDYILVFYSLYALQYMILSYFHPNYYHPDTWTLKKEFITLMIFIPIAACITYVYVVCTVPEFEISLHSFIRIQYCNSILMLLSIFTFGYYVDIRLNTYTLAKRDKPNRHATSRVNLTEQQARDILQTLHETMETEQHYLSPECSLPLVSESTGIPVHHISYALNKHSEYNFSDFINKYRVEHVCRVIQKGHHKKLTLEAIGMECGFGGKVTFFNAFKKFTGTTPAEYQAIHQTRSKNK